MQGAVFYKQLFRLGVFATLALQLIHHVLSNMLLQDLYTETASMWRVGEDVVPLIWMLPISQLVVGFLFAAGYIWWRGKITVGQTGTCNCPYRKSIILGGWLGLIIGVPKVTTYVWMPFETPELPIYWALGTIVQWVLVSIVVTAAYRAPETK